MTMYDEGMMDEGAASLRDRDMIAGKRGGPGAFVSLSLARGWRVPHCLVRPSCVTHLTHAHTNAQERTPVTGLTDLVVIFRGRDCTVV